MIYLDFRFSDMYRFYHVMRKVSYATSIPFPTPEHTFICNLMDFISFYDQITKNHDKESLSDAEWKLFPFFDSKLSQVRSIYLTMYLVSRRECLIYSKTESSDMDIWKSIIKIRFIWSRHPPMYMKKWKIHFERERLRV